MFIKIMIFVNKSIITHTQKTVRLSL